MAQPPYKVLEQGFTEYQWPGTSELRSDVRARDVLHQLDSRFSKAMNRQREEAQPDLDYIINRAAEIVSQKHPEFTPEQAFAEMDKLVKQGMSNMGRNKLVTDAGIDTALEGGAATTRFAIQPDEESVKAIKEGKPWFHQEDAIIANMSQDDSIPQSERVAIVNKDWGKLSAETWAKVGEQLQPQYGPPHKQEGGLKKFFDTLGTTGRAGGGLRTGLERELASLSGPVEVPGEKERAQYLSNVEKAQSQSWFNSSPGQYKLLMPTPIAGKSSGMYHGISLPKALGALAKNPEKIGDVWESMKIGFQRGWDKPETPEADMAVFLGEQLQKYKDAALKKAIEETGIQLADESSPEQRMLANRTADIFNFLMNRDMGEAGLNHPIITQFASEMILDPINLGMGLVKYPFAALRGALGVGSKIPKVGKAFSMTEKALDEAGKITRGALSTTGRVIMEKTGFGHVPHSMEFGDIARNSPEMAKEAREMQNIIRVAPGKAIPLAKKEDEMFSLLDTIRKGGDEDIQHLLYKAQEGDLDALTKLKAYKGAEGVKIKKAQVALRELARKEWDYRSMVGETRAFEPGTGMLEEARQIDAGTFAPREPVAAGEGPTAWMDGLRQRPGDLGEATRGAHRRVGGEFEYIENAHEAWRKRLSSITGQTGRSGVVNKTTMAAAFDRGFAKTFEWENPETYLRKLTEVEGGEEVLELVNKAHDAGDVAARARIAQLAKKGEAGKIGERALDALSKNDAAKTYAAVKTATTGVEWGALDKAVTDELKGILPDRIGAGPAGISDYVRRLVGESPELGKGKGLVVAPRALARDVARRIALTGTSDLGKTLNTIMTTIKPLQGIARAAYTVPSLAFQVSQAASTPFIAFVAHGAKGLSPILHRDALQASWYSVLRRSPVLNKIPGIKQLLGRDANKLASKMMDFEGGSRALGELVDFFEDIGMSGQFKTKFGLDAAEGLAGKLQVTPKLVKELTNATDYVRKGLDETVFRPFFWTNDLIDNQQKFSVFLGAIKDPNDINDLYRAAEFARVWSVGNVSGTGIGPTERLIREAFGFYGFNRWVTQWFARSLTNPDHLRWIMATAKLRSGLEREWGTNAPVYSGAIQKNREHQITAPPSFQPGGDDYEGPGPRKFAMLQLEDPVTLAKSIVNNITSVLEHGKLDPTEAAFMLGPAAQVGVSFMLGFDPETKQAVDLPYFPDENTPFMQSGFGRTLMAPAQRPMREISAIWKYADPDTPQKQLDLATKLAARNAGKGFEVLVRWIRTGEWSTDESTRDYLISVLGRLYPNSPIWEVARRKREALDAAAAREKATRYNIQNLPDSFILETNQ